MPMPPLDVAPAEVLDVGEAHVLYDARVHAAEARQVAVPLGYRIYPARSDPEHLRDLDVPVPVLDAGERVDVAFAAVDRPDEDIVPLFQPQGLGGGVANLPDVAAFVPLRLSPAAHLEPPLPRASWESHQESRKATRAEASEPWHERISPASPRQR